MQHLTSEKMGEITDDTKVYDDSGSSSEISAVESVEFYDENDEDIRNFKEYCEETRPTLEHWIRAMEHTGTSNSVQLADEMWSTLQHLSRYMRDIELQAKSRRLKRINNMTGDWINFCRGEERFLHSLEIGKKTMSTLVNALKMGPFVVDLSEETTMDATDLYTRISKFSEFSRDRTPGEKIRELGICLREIVGRFGRICESEGVQHDLQIMSHAVEAVRIPKVEPEKRMMSTFHITPQRLPRHITVKAEPESTKILQDFGDYIDPNEPITEECANSPVQFIAEYSKRDRSTPLYEDIRSMRNQVIQEYVVICRLGNLTGEGIGKKRTIAKQCAAANLIKSLLSKQKRDKLPPEARLLSNDEKLLGIRLMSEYLDFEKELERISHEDYFRPPIYAPVINSTGIQVRCKALGYNAVGFGKTKEIARRMGAKLILDLYKESKELKKKELKQKMQASKPTFIRPSPVASTISQMTDF